MILLYIFPMTLLGAFGAFQLKKASGCSQLYQLLVDKHFYWGGLLYVVATLLHVAALSVFDASLILPLTSITYVWTMVIAKLFLNERISVLKVLGTCSIILGAYLMIK